MLEVCVQGGMRHTQGLGRYRIRRSNMKHCPICGSSKFRTGQNGAQYCDKCRYILVPKVAGKNGFVTYKQRRLEP